MVFASSKCLTIRRKVENTTTQSIAIYMNSQICITESWACLIAQRWLGAHLVYQWTDSSDIETKKQKRNPRKSYKRWSTLYSKNCSLACAYKRWIKVYACILVSRVLFNSNYAHSSFSRPNMAFASALSYWSSILYNLLTACSAFSVLMSSIPYW